MKNSELNWQVKDFCILEIFKLLFMRIFLTFLIISLVTFSCSPSQDSDFQHLYQNFQQTIDQEPLLRAFLEKRLFLDTVLIIPKEKEIERVLVLCKKQLTALHEIELDRIDPSLHEHYNNTHSFLDIIINNIETEKIHQTDPAFYDPLPFLDYVSQSNNLYALNLGLDRTVLHFKTAIKNLNSGSTEDLEKGVSTSIKAFEFLSEDLKRKIKKLKAEKAEEKEALIKLTRAKLETKNYIAFCNSKLFDLGNK